MYASCASWFTNSRLNVYRADPTVTVENGAVVTLNWQVNLDTSTDSVYIWSGFKFMDAVQIHWRSSELSLFDRAYASQLASRLHIKYDTAITTTTLPSQTASPGSTPTLPKSTSSPSPSALDRGTITGISVGASFGLITLAIAAFHLYKWRKRKTSHNDQEEQGGGDTVPGIAELQDPRQQASELEVKEKVGELSSPVAELDAENKCKGREELRVEGALS
jgi:hypothetical protein